MHGSEHCVAVANRRHEHSNSDEVVDIVEVAPANHHLLVDRVELLRAAGHLATHLGFSQVGLNRGNHLPDELLALGVALRDEILDLGVQLRLQHRERKVFELGLHRLDAEPVSERRIDLERLLSLALGGVGSDEAPGARVVKSVGELDHQHADVFRHCDDHLAHGLCLRRLAVLHLVEFGDAVDKHRDLFAELSGQLVERVVGVFDGVVQKRSGNRHRGNAEFCKNLCDRNRVGDVGLAAATFLAAVCPLSHGIGAFNHREVGFGPAAAHGTDQLIHRTRSTSAREDARHQTPQRNAVLRTCFVARHVRLLTYGD